MFNTLKEEVDETGYEYLEEGVLNKVKQSLVKARRWITSKDKKNLATLDQSGSFQDYLEDIMEDIKLLKDPKEIAVYMKKLDNYINILESDIEMGQKDLDDTEIPRLKKTNIRIIVKNMQTFKNNLKQIINRLSKRVEMTNKHKIEKE